MKRNRKKRAFLFQILLMLCFLFYGCEKETPSKPAVFVPEETSEKNLLSTKKESRDYTSVVRIPEAPGTTVFSCELAAIDASNAAEGYIMAEYTGSNEKVKLQITGPNQITYTYTLHGAEYEVFPLTAGDGSYTIGIYENISDTKYSIALSAEIDVALNNPFGPFLYPNQYVNFNASSLPVIKAASLASGAATDLEVAELVYNYMIENFSYDYDKAASVTSGYLPVVDEVYQSGTGICFDYAAVMASMLRSQDIPTRLEVGYMKEQYHAWISIYIEDTGWMNGIIEFDGTMWHMLDPTSASISKTPKTFLAETSIYTTKYVY